jgi:hypothetical protein
VLGVLRRYTVRDGRKEEGGERTKRAEERPKKRGEEKERREKERREKGEVVQYERFANKTRKSLLRRLPPSRNIQKDSNGLDPIDTDGCPCTGYGVEETGHWVLKYLHTVGAYPLLAITQSLPELRCGWYEE